MTNWTKHTGTERPSELAPAQIVEWSASADRPASFDRADGAIPWFGGAFMPFYYRPALDPDGLPYVSAEGLTGGTKYVAKDKDGAVISFGAKPRYMESIGEWDFLPGDADHLTVNELYTGDPGPEFAIPGPPENSLARVWRE